MKLQNIEFIKLLRKAKKSANEKVFNKKSLYESANSLNQFLHLWIKDQWDNGFLKPLLAWIVWLFIGTIFYSQVSFDGNFAKGFYFSVSVGYSIGWGVLKNKNQASMIFSIFYLLIGALAISRWLAFLIETAIRDNDSAYHQFVLKKNLERTCNLTGWSAKVYVYVALNISKLFIIYVWVLFAIFGAMFTCLTIGWTPTEGVYFSLSSMSTAGLYGIPADSPDYMFVITGVFSALGVPVMAQAVGNIAVLMVDAAKQTKLQQLLSTDISKEEIDMLELLQYSNNSNNNGNNSNNSNNGNNSSIPGIDNDKGSSVTNEPNRGVSQPTSNNGHELLPQNDDEDNLLPAPPNPQPDSSSSVKPRGQKQVRSDSSNNTAAQPLNNSSNSRILRYKTSDPVPSGTATKSIDKNEYLILSLVRMNLVEIEVINQIFARFDRLDTERDGQITLSSMYSRVNMHNDHCLSDSGCSAETSIELLRQKAQQESFETLGGGSGDGGVVTNVMHSDSYNEYSSAV